MGKLFVIFILAVASLPVAPKAQGSWFIEKFDWLPSECAHKQYPMRLLEGDLFLKDGSSLYVPASATIDNGWGEIGSTHVVGSTFKSLPTKLTATWYSFAEDKFFIGEFGLPYDHILELFKQGMTSRRTGDKTTYSRIIIGFGPEGAVSVWIAGQRIILEVANYKGTEITLPWKAVTSSEKPKSDYITGVLEHRLTSQQLYDLKEHGIRPGTSDHYRKQYRWTVSVSGQHNPTLWLKTFNGEREYFDFSKTSIFRPSRGIPKLIEVSWETNTGKKYEADINFDEAEVSAAYKKLSDENGGKPMQLHLEIGDDPRVIHVSLRDQKYIIKLQNNAVNAYTRR